MISVGRTWDGISGSGGAAAPTRGEGAVLQAESASADSAMATSGQPKLRFPIDDLPLLLSAASQNTPAGRPIYSYRAHGKRAGIAPDGTREVSGNLVSGEGPPNAHMRRPPASPPAPLGPPSAADRARCWCR